MIKDKRLHDFQNFKPCWLSLLLQLCLFLDNRLVEAVSCKFSSNCRGHRGRRRRLYYCTERQCEFHPTPGCWGGLVSVQTLQTSCLFVSRVGSNFAWWNKSIFFQISYQFDTTSVFSKYLVELSLMPFEVKGSWGWILNLNFTIRLWKYCS